MALKAALGRILVGTVSAAVLAGCGSTTDNWPVSVDSLPATLDSQLQSALNAAGLTAVAPAPQNAARVALGQALMFDKILSGNKDISCATCHHPLTHTGDALSVSIGTGGRGLGAARVLGAGRSFIPRNAPDVFNRVGFTSMFWDGRVSGTAQVGFVTPARGQLPVGLDSALAAQAMFPVTSRDEMRGNRGDRAVDGTPNEIAAVDDADFTGIWAALLSRLRNIPQYVALFQAAYPDVPPDQLGFQHAANAIAAFESEQWTALNTPFDRYLGGHTTALTEAQKRGALLFYGEARCSQCHSGGLLTDQQFHSIAAPQVGPGRGTEAPLDFGRERETAQTTDRFKFRTPPLRNVALTGPWTHSGAYTSLEAVVRHKLNPAAALQSYNPTQLDSRFQSQVHVQESIQAGVLNSIDPILSTPINLTQAQIHDLVAFLEALTDPASLDQSHEVPASVPSGLPVVD